MNNKYIYIYKKGPRSTILGINLKILDMAHIKYGFSNGFLNYVYIFRESLIRFQTVLRITRFL